MILLWIIILSHGIVSHGKYLLIETGHNMTSKDYMEAGSGCNPGSFGSCSADNAQRGRGGKVKKVKLTVNLYCLHLPQFILVRGHQMSPKDPTGSFILKVRK